jgi:hypothetical protein
VGTSKIENLPSACALHLLTHGITADTGDVHGLSWLHNELTGHVLAFESDEQQIPNAVEPACGAMKFLLPSAANEK